jgi:hypothetical protein
MAWSTPAHGFGLRTEVGDRLIISVIAGRVEPHSGQLNAPTVSSGTFMAEHRRRTLRA